MERTRPGEINLLGPESFRSDSADAPDHFFGGASGERQQQDAMRINPLDHKVCNPMGKGLRLPGTSASNYQERRSFPRGFEIYAMRNGATLSLVQISQILKRHGCQPLLIRGSAS